MLQGAEEEVSTGREPPYRERCPLLFSPPPPSSIPTSTAGEERGRIRREDRRGAATRGRARRSSAAWPAASDSFRRCRGALAARCPTSAVRSESYRKRFFSGKKWLDIWADGAYLALLVHDPVAALPASDGVLGPNLVLAMTLVANVDHWCFNSGRCPHHCPWQILYFSLVEVNQAILAGSFSTSSHSVH